MTLITCLSCGFTLRVEGDEREESTLVGRQSDFFLNDLYCCAECGERAGCFSPPEITSRAGMQLRIMEVTPQEAFAALNGLGLPEERSCLLSDVQESMKTCGVKRIVGKNLPGTSRCIIDFIELNDGSKFYLGASTEGATVFRATRPHSYVEKNDA